MNKSGGQVIFLGSAAYLDFLEDTYGKENVHFPLDTEEWKRDKKFTLNRLFEAAGDASVITYLELNYAANQLTLRQTTDLLRIVQEHNSGLVVLKDMYTEPLAVTVEEVFTRPHVVLDANKAGIRDIQSAIDSLLEQPGPSHLEQGP